MSPLEEIGSVPAPDNEEDSRLVEIKSKDYQKLAEEIYSLLKQDIRTENERNGTPTRF